MIAALFLRGPSQWRSTQLYAALSCAADEPLARTAGCPVEHLRPGREPVERPGLLGPEPFGVVLGPVPECLVLLQAAMWAWRQTRRGGKTRVSCRILVIDPPPSSAVIGAGSAIAWASVKDEDDGNVPSRKLEFDGLEWSGDQGNAGQAKSWILRPLRPRVNHCILPAAFFAGVGVLNRSRTSLPSGTFGSSRVLPARSASE